jgi:tetraacyldisaccharide 4'-kinase
MSWSQRVQAKLNACWYKKSLCLISIILLPFSWLFALIVKTRRFLYKAQVFKSYRIKRPIIVVGNITVGGTGKTPFVIWLVSFLKSNGYSPGIITRGVGGQKQIKPYWVTTETTTETVGDEAVLLLQKANCPVIVCVDRVRGATELVNNTQCDVIICDDGLQHYRLQRDLEIAIIDGERQFGNNQLLPAGPLREPISRLNNVDFIIINGNNKLSSITKPQYQMSLLPTHFIALNNLDRKIALTEFPVKKIHGLAGIGNPDRFFTLLARLGFDVIPHYFADHYNYQAHDLIFDDTLPIIMTEKDAVKCRRFNNEQCWYLPIFAKLEDEFETQLLRSL